MTIHETKALYAPGAAWQRVTIQPVSSDLVEAGQSAAGVPRERRRFRVSWIGVRLGKTEPRTGAYSSHFSGLRSV